MWPQVEMKVVWTHIVEEGLVSGEGGLAGDGALKLMMKREMWREE